MNFNPMGKLDELKGKAVIFGAEQGAEILRQANQLLNLLQSVGYQIGALDMDLALPPTVTVELKAGPRVDYAKLDAIYAANKENDVLAMILGALIQANKLRDKITLDTIELKGTKLVLKTPPGITLQWKEKAATSVVVV